MDVMCAKKNIGKELLKGDSPILVPVYDAEQDSLLLHWGGPPLVYEANSYTSTDDEDVYLVLAAGASLCMKQCNA
jgi:hypothetical protein